MTTRSHTTTSRTRSIALLAATLALAAALLAAGTASAKPKPGFGPGTWVGKGTITGTSTDGPMTVHFDGGIAFTLKVSASLAATGSGSWRLDMLGSEDAPSDTAIDSTLQGRAAITLAGTGSRVTFSGIQKVVGEIRSGGSSRPLAFQRPLTGALTITRAGACKVSGQTRLPDGVRLVWSATRKGGGTCRT